MSFGADWLNQVVQAAVAPPEPTKESLPSYSFYNGEVTLYYDDAAHSYTRFDDATGTMVEVPSVTTLLHIIDKSPALVPWSAKVCVELLRSKIVQVAQDGSVSLAYPASLEELEKLLDEAKNRHKTILEEAGDLGHLAHTCLEDSIKHAIEHTGGVVVQFINVPENEKARNCAYAAHDWMKKHNVRWLHTERKIYSRKHDIAGTMDGLCLVDSCGDRTCCGEYDVLSGTTLAMDRKDVPSVADWKTSNYFHIAYGYQTAFYLEAEVEEKGIPIEDRWVLLLGKEEPKFKPYLFTYDYFEEHLNCFLDAARLYRSHEAAGKRESERKRELKSGIKAAKEIEAEAERAKKAEQKAQAKLEKEQAKLAEQAKKRQEREAAKLAKSGKLLSSTLLN